MKKLILDTDWFTDCDDAGALKLLLEERKAGKIDLLGININVYSPYSVRSVDAVLRANGVTEMPIGIDTGATEYPGEMKYQELTARHSDRTEYEEAVRLYRRLLAASAEQVEIISIGFLNNLEKLLKSGADEFSPLDGKTLVREKVKKIWIMGGIWNRDGGQEYNFGAYVGPMATHASAYVCREMPVPMIFSGSENGVDTISGKHLPKDGIIYEIYNAWGVPEGRSSWDPMVALMAVTDDLAAAGYTPVYGIPSVEPENGKNHFTPDPDAMHCYVTKNYPPEYYGELIDGIICR